MPCKAFTDLNDTTTPAKAPCKAWQLDSTGGLFQPNKNGLQQGLQSARGFRSRWPWAV